MFSMSFNVDQPNKTFPKSRTKPRITEQILHSLLDASSATSIEYLGDLFFVKTPTNEPGNPNETQIPL